ncbi:hypothetical protein I656_00578 [Geobacillus sp. WSUCF1]|nr:hypothetical protein I656_00578 [Geobacillus sp. WSUCF1]
MAATKALAATALAVASLTAFFLSIKPKIPLHFYETLRQ